MKNGKKQPKNVAHNRPKPFFPQSSPGHSPQTKINFPYYEISDQTSVILSVVARWEQILQKI